MAVRVTLLVCALNEAGNVGAVLRRVPPAVDEILVMDGGSVDATRAEALAAGGGRVRVELQSGRGKGAAMLQGFRAARGEVVVSMDADGSMEPGEIPAFLEAIDQGADLAKGTRMLPHGGSADLTSFRRFGNALFCGLGNLVTGARFSDLCYGFLALRRDALDGLELHAHGFDIEAELCLKMYAAGRRVVEVPSFESRRASGHSHLGAFRDGARIMRRILTVRPGGTR
jgi:glycosyltransferase involved in cell wall biosynthesis